MNSENEMLKNLRKLITYTVFPLILGSLIYYLFFPNVIFVRIIDSYLPFHVHFSLPSHPWVICFLRNYFFDFIWALAMTECVYFVLNIKNKHSGLILFAGILAFEIFLEAIQISEYLPGTFDVGDIFIEMFASIIVIFFINRRIMQ